MPPERLDAIQSAVDKFVAVYYHRDAALTENDFRDAVSPLVTRSFLERYPPELSTESDQWVRDNDGGIDATATIAAGDAGATASRTVVTINVTVTGEAGGKKEDPYEFSVQLDMIWQDGWKVTAFI